MLLVSVVGRILLKITSVSFGVSFLFALSEINACLLFALCQTRISFFPTLLDIVMVVNGLNVEWIFLVITWLILLLCCFQVIERDAKVIQGPVHIAVNSRWPNVTVGVPE